MTQTARQQASEMTDATERTLAATFGWSRAEERLYRDCPTAFWLAPDGGGVLPPPPPGPVMPAAEIDEVASEAVPIEDVPAAHVSVAGMANGMFRALLAAGPIFAATALMLNRAEFDDHWWQPLVGALLTVFAAPLTVAFGALLAALPVVIGVLGLGKAGSRFPALRTPMVWVAAGGTMGAGIAAIFGAGATAGLALIATSVACARIARAAVDWTDPVAA